MNPLFVKLMMMTTSQHDAEALAAMRKANAILAAANVNWEEFLSAVFVNQQQAAPPPPPPPPRAGNGDDFQTVGNRYDDAATIDRMFERAFASTPRTSGFREFLDDVHGFWEQKGFLTGKQYDAVRRAGTGRRR